MLAVRTPAHPPREARQSRPEHWDMGVVIPDRIPSSSARRRTAKLHLPGGLQNRPLHGAVRVAAVTLTGA